MRIIPTILVFVLVSSLCLAATTETIASYDFEGSSTAGWIVNDGSLSIEDLDGDKWLGFTEANDATDRWDSVTYNNSLDDIQQGDNVTIYYEYYSPSTGVSSSQSSSFAFAIESTTEFFVFECSGTAGCNLRQEDNTVLNSSTGITAQTCADGNSNSYCNLTIDFHNSGETDQKFRIRIDNDDGTTSQTGWMSHTEYNMTIGNAAGFGNVGDTGKVREGQINYFEVNRTYHTLEDVPPSLSNINCISCMDDGVPPYTTTDTTPTFNFTTDINAWCRFGDEDLNYTGMGVGRNGTCSGEGTTSHICTLDPSNELFIPSDYVYIGCKDSSGNENSSSSSGSLEIDLTGLEETTDNSILMGINASSIWPGATVLQGEMIYTRDKNDNQAVGTVDYLAISGDQQWALNYITEGESATGLFNLSPVLYVWEATNLTTAQIIQQVSGLINSTKS